ncbi:thiol peroxidase [Campylobacter sp. MIT 21-1685]|uniref:thiol peroxidase n=1 Tax=unclassified Campylobacter TaxID=2593542 RepID=UPI00224AC361|nr:MULTISPECIES: thiol peroxidase [unclassified Campylobacter]MCX2683165.1 thiol peroxidase [Campylobacter sp. MIT 21-1684]MCX2751376.1 thiol peroxidase [Campylobacter sp. MIT 21-1682]MCX2807575.1 thiol peroxidase [Campylobacter sp. MIT 21-1685]
MAIKFQGEEVLLKGKPLKIGDNAPEVKLVGRDFSEIKVGGKQDKIQIISVIPSIDGTVCSLQAKRFDEEAAKLKDCIVYIVSVDIPFAMERFYSNTNAGNIILVSDFIDKTFGEKYGLILTNSLLKGMLTRAVLIIDKEGKLIYQEICEDLANEPNYQMLLDKVKTL